MTEPYQIPTEDQLQNLASGCFVRVAGNSGCFWVEVDGEEDGLLTGIVHLELASSDCRCSQVNAERVRFSRDQVKYVGCDRYCFC